MRPIIGIISRNKQLDGNKISSLQYDYVNAVYKAGGMPLIIPIINDDELLLELISKMDGLLIPGGIDVNPKWYHEEIKQLCGSIDDELDVVEIKIIKMATDRKIPILAICRGHQILNVVFNGSLHQDLSYNENYDPNMVHEQNKIDLPKYEPVHNVKISEDSILFEIVGSNIDTNSYHHQIVNGLGENLKVVGRSREGIIEAYESTSDHFILSLQWHPEKMIEYREEQLNIFKRYIEECRSCSERLSNC
ncbi:MAG: hypothetical protein K0Q49_2133 [Haloplasmataceae bacterium]|jgi:putative glutamine amidotransferase|nr:hypothetical protein [Haloplasmataceae bacterium]